MALPVDTPPEPDRVPSLTVAEANENEQESLERLAKRRAFPSTASVLLAGIRPDGPVTTDRDRVSIQS